jgi:hypothetical protein
MKSYHDACGCYGDGTNGHQHTRERCAQVLDYYVNENFVSRGVCPPGTPAQVIQDLMGEMSDDAGEEYEACAWLNEHAPFTGAVWDWQDGDFGLWPSEGE